MPLLNSFCIINVSLPAGAPPGAACNASPKDPSSEGGTHVNAVLQGTTRAAASGLRRLLCGGLGNLLEVECVAVSDRRPGLLLLPSLLLLLLLLLPLELLLLPLEANEVEWDGLARRSPLLLLALLGPVVPLLLVVAPVNRI